MMRPDNTKPNGDLPGANGPKPGSKDGEKPAVEPKPAAQAAAEAAQVAAMSSYGRESGFPDDDQGAVTVVPSRGLVSRSLEWAKDHPVLFNLISWPTVFAAGFFGHDFIDHSHVVDEANGPRIVKPADLEDLEKRFTKLHESLAQRQATLESDQTAIVASQTESAAKLEELGETIETHHDRNLIDDLTKTILGLTPQANYQDADQFHVSLSKIVGLPNNTSDLIKALDKAIAITKQKVNDRHEEARSVYLEKMKAYLKTQDNSKTFSFDFLDKNLPAGYQIVYPKKEDREAFLENATDVHMLLCTEHNTKGGHIVIAANEIANVNLVKAAKAEYPSLAIHLELNGIGDPKTLAQDAKASTEALIAKGYSSNQILLAHLLGNGINNAIFAETEGDVSKTGHDYLFQCTIGQVTEEGELQFWVNRMNMLDPVTNVISPDRVNLYKLELARMILLTGGSCDKDYFTRGLLGPVDKNGNKAAVSVAIDTMRFLDAQKAYDAIVNEIGISVALRTIEMYKRAYKELDDLGVKVSLSEVGANHGLNWDPKAKQFIPDPALVKALPKGTFTDLQTKGRKVVLISTIDPETRTPEGLTSLND